MEVSMAASDLSVSPTCVKLCCNGRKLRNRLSGNVFDLGCIKRRTGLNQVQIIIPDCLFYGCTTALIPHDLSARVKTDDDIGQVPYQLRRKLAAFSKLV